MMEASSYPTVGKEGREEENVEAGGCEGGRAGGIMSWRCTRQGGKIDKLSAGRTVDPTHTHARATSGHSSGYSFYQEEKVLFPFVVASAAVDPPLPVRFSNVLSYGRVDGRTDARSNDSCTG